MCRHHSEPRVPSAQITTSATCSCGSGATVRRPSPRPHPRPAPRCHPAPTVTVRCRPPWWSSPCGPTRTPPLSRRVGTRCPSPARARGPCTQLGTRPRPAPPPTTAPARAVRRQATRVWPLLWMRGRGRRWCRRSGRRLARGSGGGRAARLSPGPGNASSWTSSLARTLLIRNRACDNGHPLSAVPSSCTIHPTTHTHSHSPSHTDTCTLN